MSQTLPPFSCIYSLNIPELLLELNCTIAISTYQAGKLIFISAKDKNALVQLGKTIKKPMGLAFDGSRLAVAAKESVLLYSSSPWLAPEYPRQPKTYDNLFLPRAQYFTGVTDIHDLVWIGEKLLMVNTRFSCLAWLDERFNFLPYWKPAFISQLMPEDRCHLNGVALNGDKPEYVSMLGKTDTAEGWRNNKSTGGLIMHVESGEVVVEGLPMPHTPRLLNDGLFVLLSATGELVKVDANTGKYDVIKKFPGYVRGMAFYKGFLFVAFSRIREKHSAFSDLPIAASSNEAGIAILHFASGNIVGEIKYRNSVEEIYDVQIIPNLRPGMVNFEQQERDLAISLPGFGFWGLIYDDDKKNDKQEQQDGNDT
jgi:uncharacterized protein (TIGR03032 family)